MDAIDVVIPVHDHWELTERCLERLRDQTVPATVVLCDNGSTDDTPTRVRQAFPDVRLLELGSNLGFAVACNRGVAAGSGEAVVLLNNDVECRRDFLERLTAPLWASEGVGSVAALLVQPGGERIDSLGLTVDATLAGYPRLHGAPRSEAQALDPVLTGPAGAAGAYRRIAWEEVAGLDEGAFSYGEDVDLALRLRSAGWSAAAAVEAVAVHIGSASAVARSKWQRYQGGFSRGYFLRRYGVLRRRSALRALTTEAIAVAGDACVFSHDLAALHGRVAGWRAAGGRPCVPFPPAEAIASGITFAESLRLRLRMYSRDDAACT